MNKKGVLYLITDFSYGEDKIREALSCGVDFVQLREKNITSREYLAKAKMLKKMTAHYGTVFIVNDRADIALLSEADGVHLGADDIEIADARKILGEKAVIGATAKTVAQAVAAEKQGADYIGSGAWFDTTTKADAVPISQSTYQEIIKSAPVTNVAVGGITAENCHIPLECGASGVAVSKGIMAADNISETIKKIRDELNKHI